VYAPLSHHASVPPSARLWTLRHTTMPPAPASSTRLRFLDDVEGLVPAAHIPTRRYGKTLRGSVSKVMRVVFSNYDREPFKAVAAISLLSAVGSGSVSQVPTLVSPRLSLARTGWSSSEWGGRSDGVRE